MGIATSSPRRSNRRVSERSSLSRRSSQSMTSGITFECFKLLIWTISNLLSNRSNITSTHNLEHPCSKSAPNKGGLIFSGFAFQNERSRRLHLCTGSGLATPQQASMPMGTNLDQATKPQNLYNVVHLYKTFGTLISANGI